MRWNLALFCCLCLVRQSEEEKISSVNLFSGESDNNEDDGGGVLVKDKGGR